MKKITEVDSITDIADTDKIFVCGGNDIKQITKQNLLKSMQTQVDTINSSLGVMENILFTVTIDSPVTKKLGGVYLVSYWQAGGWIEKGFGILYVSGYSPSSIYKPLYDSESAAVEITSNGDGTATFKSNIIAALFFSLTKLM